MNEYLENCSKWWVILFRQRAENLFLLSSDHVNFSYTSVMGQKNVSLKTDFWREIWMPTRFFATKVPTSFCTVHWSVDQILFPKLGNRRRCLFGHKQLFFFYASIFFSPFIVFTLNKKKWKKGCNYPKPCTR